MFIDTPRQIAETLYFSLRCVDGLLGKDLRYAFDSIYTTYMMFFRGVSIWRLKPLLGKVS
jgi:hypothetical protein